MTEAELTLELRSQARLLAAARAMTGQFAQRIGFDEIEAGQIGLAVDEALCNIINHGYERRNDGRIVLSLFDLSDGTDASPAEMAILIEDRARQVDPAAIRPRDLDDIRPGGLGVHIIREVMDEVVYEKRDGGGMRLRMVKRATSGTPARAGMKGAE